MSRKAIGTLLVSVSACAFGSYAYFATLAYRAGVGPISLLLYRFGLATIVLGFFVAVAKVPLPKLRSWLPLLGLGLLYVGQSYTYLQCLLTSNPITASLLLYLYPVFVAAGSVLFLKERLTVAKCVALACALAGSFLVIGPVAGVSPIAILYGLGTALFYAAYLLIGKRVLEKADPLVATLAILATAALAYGIGSLVLGVDVPHRATGWIGVTGLALVATVIAIGALLLGLKRTTPVEASSLSALEPLVTALLAVAFLGQSLTGSLVLGGLLIIVAVLVLARSVAGDRVEAVER